MKDNNNRLSTEQSGKVDKDNRCQLLIEDVKEAVIKIKRCLGVLKVDVEKLSSNGEVDKESDEEIEETDA